MKTDKEKSSEKVLTPRIKWLFIIVALFVLAFIIFRINTLFPPDISKCNRITIRYYPSELECLTGLYGGKKQVLDNDEIEFLESINLLEITDKEIIHTLANYISSGKYKGLKNPRQKHMYFLYVNCFSYGKHLTTFIVDGDAVFSTRGIEFELSPGRFIDIIKVTLPSKAMNLHLRQLCAYRLSVLYGNFMEYDMNMYPDPNQWCDLLFMYNNNILSSFTCLSAGEGKCHYAMNPNCKPDSPDDMVLLFETNDGWNQHGGPGLFTFDNHEPKGGCVLFNDGTVKFIRTEAELNQLRWE